jgi:hypothetical protein
MYKQKSAGLIVPGAEICDLRSHCFITSTFTDLEGRPIFLILYPNILQGF